MTLNPGTSGTPWNSSVQPKRKVPLGTGCTAVTSHLHTEDEPVDPARRGVVPAAVPREQWPSLCRLSRGKHLFMLPFMSFWRIKYSCSFLYLNTTEWALHCGFLVPDTCQLFQKLWHPITCLEHHRCDGGSFTSKSRRSQFSCGRGGRFQEVPKQSFAISPWKGEEERDKERADGWQGGWLLHKGRSPPQACERAMRVQRLCKCVCTNQKHAHNKSFPSLLTILCIIFS